MEVEPLRRRRPTSLPSTAFTPASATAAPDLKARLPPIPPLAPSANEVLPNYVAAAAVPAPAIAAVPAPAIAAVPAPATAAATTFFVGWVLRPARVLRDKTLAAAFSASLAASACF
ncbi:MAG: hypothetical protein FRX48_07812 [Lasallia pustulata]|uniref:Uncharacterized protein n=1 Tax=Lasallia pustulata TaxID=136370 RepID=A0A5M8PFH0_9LECA|nr:MAG: hypothetical protein FRX48_07812 [Lasallia pustulata]